MRYDVGRFRRPMRRSTEGQMMSLISLGDGSTLTLDFTTGQLDPRLTFSRTSNATFINASGNVATASNNVARFDHDPTTLAPKGLLIEGTATNLCLRSEDFGNAPWQKDNNSATNPDVFTVSQTAPNGASTVNRVTLNKTGGTFSRLYQAITGTAGQTYTMSVWMKANTANGGAATQNVSLRIGGSTGINCVVTTTWQRFTHPAFAITGTDANFQLLLWDNVPANDETADVLIWGAQLEAGSGASSYIPTGASTVQRLADECQLLDLTTMGFNASAGTIFVDMGARINTGSNRSYTFLPASGGNNQIFEGSGVAFQVFNSGSFVAQIGSSFSSAQKIASAYAVNDYAVSVNGAAVATDTSGAVPSSLTKLTIGGSIINTAAYQFGCIRTFKYWPTRLPNATLQSLTT